MGRQEDTMSVESTMSWAERMEDRDAAKEGSRRCRCRAEATVEGNTGWYCQACWDIIIETAEPSR